MSALFDLDLSTLPAASHLGIDAGPCGVYVTVTVATPADLLAWGAAVGHQGPFTVSQTSCDGGTVFRNTYAYVERKRAGAEVSFRIGCCEMAFEHRGGRLPPYPDGLETVPAYEGRRRAVAA